MELFEAADLPGRALVVGRLQGDHRRPPHRVGADPAAPGDPDLRRRGLFDLGHHRPGLGRGDQQSGRDRSASCSTRRPRRKPVRIVVAVPGRLAVAVGRRPAGRASGCRPSTRSSPDASSKTPGVDADIRLSYGATEAKVPDIVDVRRRHHRDRPGAAGGRASGSSTLMLTSLHRADRQPGVVRRPREARTPWSRSTPCCRVCSRPAARCW